MPSGARAPAAGLAGLAGGRRRRAPSSRGRARAVVRSLGDGGWPTRAGMGAMTAGRAEAAPRDDRRGRAGAPGAPRPRRRADGERRSSPRRWPATRRAPGWPGSTATGEVIARVACPPGRPSRWRPVVAAAVALDMAPALADRVLVARARARGGGRRCRCWRARSPRGRGRSGEEGLALVRAAARGRRSWRSTPSTPRASRSAASRAPACRSCASTASAVSGRLGATHGMGAGHRRAGGGPRAWPRRPSRPATTRGCPRGCRPGWSAAARAWSRTSPTRPRRRRSSSPGPASDGARVLLRQAPAPLASPDTGGRGAREVRGGRGERRAARAAAW